MSLHVRDTEETSITENLKDNQVSRTVTGHDGNFLVAIKHSKA